MNYKAFWNYQHSSLPRALQQSRSLHRQPALRGARRFFHWKRQEFPSGWEFIKVELWASAILGKADKRDSNCGGGGGGGVNTGLLMKMTSGTTGAGRNYTRERTEQNIDKLGKVRKLRSQLLTHDYCF